MLKRISRLLTASALVGATLVVTPIAAAPVSAAGTPDIDVTKTMPAEVLVGESIPVSLSIANSTGTDGYNMLVRDVLPAGVSYVPGSATPDPIELAQGDGTTVLVWSNIADSLDNTNVIFNYTVFADATFDAGDTVVNDASAYVNSNPRTLPVVSGSDGTPVASSFTGNDSDSASTLLVPFNLTKSEPNDEDELLRGVHDHQTVYTLRVENNLVGPSTNFSVIDFLPAEIEFLGCGNADNSATEEYPGSGPIPDYVPALPNGACVVPSSVTTVELDPDGPGPLPIDVFTRIEWDGAAIAAARGSNDLAAGGEFFIDFVAGIPLRENTFPGPATATSNLDNNTGPYTTESEAEIRNTATATGTYSGNDFTDGAADIVIAEDVSIHKNTDSETFIQGQDIVYTLDIESSEYVTSTGTITVTDTLPAAVDFVSATPAPTSGPVESGDGRLIYTWVLPAFSAPSGTAQIVINTTVRENYRLDGGGDGTPVAANDAFTNETDLETVATTITNVDGTTEDLTVLDESSVSSSSGSPTILKEVSVPQASLTCADGSGVAFDPSFASAYRPGDHVCFRLTVNFPPSLDTLNPLIQDFLPAGFSYDSFALGGSNTVPVGDITFTDDSPVLSWDLSDVDSLGDVFQVVIETTVTDPLAAEPTDILDNLMKMRYENLSGGVFQLRDQALAEWSEPTVALDKGVILVNSLAVPGAPADGVTIQEADVVTYQVTVSNTGTEDALDVSLRDVLPPQITCADVTNITGGGACDGANDWIQWDAADDIDLAAGGGTASFTYDVTVPTGISAGASLVNTAGVRNFTGVTNSGTPFTYVPGDNIDPTLTSNTDPADDESEIVTADPGITKVRSTELNEAGNALSWQATIGETVNYTVTVDLPAGLTYLSPEINDVVPSALDLVAGTVVAQLDGAALPAGVTLGVDDAANSWSVVFDSPYTIPPGPDQQVVVTFDAIVLDVVSNVRDANQNNTAELSFSDASGINRTESASVGLRIVEPNIVLDKTNNDADGIVDAGQEIEYTLSVENDDSAPRVSTAHDTVVVDTIPAELIILDATGGIPVADGGTVAPDGGIWNATARTITWNILTIAPGVTVELDYFATVVDPVISGASIDNTATATTTSMPGVTDDERTSTSPNAGTSYDDPAADTVIVPEFTIAKSANPAVATVGETVTYTLDVTLPAGLIGYDVTVIDDVPAGITYESLTSVACLEGGGACTPDISAALVAPTGPYTSGDDIAFFFDDILVAGAGDRVVTITYVGFVSDATAANSGATLTNEATLYWNDSDVITTPPTDVPDPGTFTESTDPSSDDIGTVEPSLSIDKDVSDQVGDTDDRRAAPGDVLTYTVTITNTGTGPAYDVTISDVPTDETWAFTDTTATAGTTNTDSDPAGGLEWTIDGPIAASGGTATITYTLTVPAGYDSSNENAAGPEQTNVADIPSYFGSPETTRDANPTRDFREYDDVTPDTVTIELDLASIGNFVWFDVNGDGVQDADEPGIADTTVTVTYLGPDGVLGGGDDEVFVTSTNADGEYLVEDLPGGAYQVDVDETDPDFIGGLEASYDLDGTTASPNGFWTGTLGEDEDKRDVDFGYTGTGSIGDTIYLDQNLDGTQGPGEDGLGGIDVTVTWLGPDGLPGGGDDIVYTATTDVDGMYLVDDLPAGNFTVEVDESDLPVGYVNVADPDTPLAPDSESAVTLAAGEDNLDQDFGYAGTGSIGDTIYLDFNGDGDQDPGEQGLENVTVELVHFGPDGVLGGTDDSFFTTVTGPGGSYLFDNLPYGNYDVTVIGGITLLDNTDDPDTAGVGDSTSQTTLTPAIPDDLDQDFGYFATSVLGDKVWLDLDGDGILDPGEPGLEGVEITINDPISGLTFTTTTDENGDYIFPNIPDADWTVTVNPLTLPAGVDQTHDFDGGNDNTSTTTLVTSDLDQDFGYQGDGTIGDTIWFDQDANGVLDGDDFGLEGVTVTLTWAQPGGDPIEFTTVTDANGNYLFENLPDGDYTVTVDTSTLPTGLVETFDFDGGDDSTSAVSLVDGNDVRLDQDFGYNSTGSIGDTVWFDRDGDGVLDPDETGLAGIDVTLVWEGPFGPVTFTTTTGPDGTYLFDNLPPGDYTVTVDETDLPAGMSPTFDANAGGDSTSSLTLALGEDNLDQDFGYNGSGSIGDTVFLDIDGDGIQGPTEPGVPGQQVDLTWGGPDGIIGTPDDVVYTTTTGPDGSYLFPGLPPSEYTVTVVGGIVDVATNTGDPGADGDSTNTIPLADGEDNLDQDFGYQGNNGLGDTVWLDLNADGLDDGIATEPRLEGVDIIVTWFGPDGVEGGGDDIIMPTATTNVDGAYLVGSLPDGTYSVTVDTATLPAGIDTNTFDDDGGVDGPDSTSIVTDLGVGTTDPQIDLDQDFGYAGSGSIGDTIWLDLDGDGIVDAEEPGIPNAVVTLTWAGPDGVFGTADDFVFPTQTTDADGMYLFENLPAGEFQVDVSNLPAGLSATADPDGGDDDSSTLTLDPGEADLDQDFGYNGDASIGDTIFLDFDGDGIQDPDEPGVPGVTVTVTSPGVDGIPGTADDLEIEVVTDDDGMYLVDGLPSGTTVVDYDPETLPPSYVPDSDLDGGDATSTTVELEDGDDVRDVDFGVVGDATIEGTVWIDTDNDGVQDPGEAGIPGVTVEVTWDGPDGPIVITVVTDDDGNWSIPNVPAGDYTTQVDLDTIPDGLVPTTPTDGNTVVPAGGSGRVDNGFVPGASIGDRIWEDTDGDGVQDPGEPGVPGVTITLTTPGGTIVGTTTTGPNGDYVFGDLPPGDYVITVDTTTVPTGFVVVVEIDGSPDGNVSITVGPGEDRTDIDFGIMIPELPRTGLYVGMTLLVALGFLAAGLALLGVRRRRDELTVS